MSVITPVSEGPWETPRALPAYRPIQVPDAIARALSRGAVLVVNVSGGKDGQAMLRILAEEHRQRGWPGRIVALHCDLGRAEWPESLPHCEKTAREAGVELVVVRRERGDLIQRMEQRLESCRGTGKPFWPSKGQRYCTSELKTDQANKWLRRNCSHVVAALGMRAQESDDRAKLPLWERREKVDCSVRDAFTWHPIHPYSGDDVWHCLGTSRAELETRRALYRAGRTEEALAGWPAHPAYVYGNDRVSCVFCILGSKNDLTVGARHHPQLLAHLVHLEDEGDATFKRGFSLRVLQNGG